MYVNKFCVCIVLIVGVCIGVIYVIAGSAYKDI